MIGQNHVTLELRCLALGWNWRGSEWSMGRWVAAKRTGSVGEIICSMSYIIIIVDLCYFFPTSIFDTPTIRLG